MTVLVTGAAGFIGYHVARRLAERGERVVGVDNMNDFYGVELKRRRLVQLSTFPNVKVHRIDITDNAAIKGALASENIRAVIHLAAQANVRHALENPHVYVASNVAGHLNILEYCRHAGSIEQIVYASSSSVYGKQSGVPFREDAVTDRPTSLYAATKKSQEMISEVYSDIFGLKQVGLRFFSVYGPWGRPDMAYWLFTEAILAGRPIRVFNEGRMFRDFTYIDDVAGGIVKVLDSPARSGESLHRVYNLGNAQPVALMDMIGILEKHLGRTAELEMMPMQPGEMPVTYADVSAIEADLGVRPRTALEDGLKRFVDWYRRYHNIR